MNAPGGPAPGHAQQVDPFGDGASEAGPDPSSFSGGASPGLAVGRLFGDV